MQARILVCEDEHFVRWALSEHLRDCGFSVFEAGDGSKALEIIRKSRPDAILLDLNMPKTDGFSVIRQLKHEKNDTPIFVLSGYGQHSSNTIASELGVSGFIKKPFRLNEIDNMLVNALSSDR